MCRTYIAIDLKSYYASVEAVDRDYNPLTTNLVVADLSRTEKTICLAVSPSLKQHGISGRARLFEVVQRVKEVNRERFERAKQLGLLPRDENGKYHFTAASYDAEALEADPSLELAYIVAPPRMRLYQEISTKIFMIYLKYVSFEDVWVYSVDEVFIDVTSYLHVYHMTAHELAMTMIRDVLRSTGITATAGIGSNMYLAKVAMDIVAKHVEADKDGVRIAELDEKSYREKLWCHTPITDFWRVGKGTANRMAGLGCHTMGDIARLSVNNEDAIYNELGVNAELLIDHAWGWEPTEIKMIRSYKPQTTSLSSGQVLSEPYDTEKAKLIVKEMTELLALDLVKKGLVTKQVVLTVNYDRASIVPLYQGRTAAESTYQIATTGKRYRGSVGLDYYGRPSPKHAHGTGNIDRWTSSARRIMRVMTELYDRIIDPDLLVRRITIAAMDLIPESQIPKEGPEQLSFFVDYQEREKQRAEEDAADEKEKRLQKATLALQKKFGKNAVLKGMNLQEGATTMLRNQQIGGHRAGANNSPHNVEPADNSIGKQAEFKEAEAKRFVPEKATDTNRFAPDTSSANKLLEAGKTTGSKQTGLDSATDTRRFEPDASKVYSDIFHLSHPQSASHPPMSLYDRSAQFSPFAALTGYNEMIAEASEESTIDPTAP